MRVGAAWASVMLALAGCSSGPSRPNIVLVSVDTLRADHLSCYGGELATPHFDRIAEEGVRFENVTSVAPTTLPAHASLLTGLFPTTHRVHDNVGFRLRAELPTLASALREAGYRTGAFVGAAVLDSELGLARGFEVYSDEIAETPDGRRERRGEAVLLEALGFMAETEEPFFAFLHFFDPHRPYDPPPPFHPGVADLKARYRGEVLYVDALLGRLLSWLDERGLADSTILAVTADHGESLGEHGEDTHGLFLYQSTLHVPLAIRGPSVPAGLRVPELARTVDVAPTLLELAGAPRPEALEGASFLSASGEVKNRELDAYSETFVPRLHYGWSELRSLREGKWKLVLAPRSELYDLDRDPGERNDLAGTEPRLARGMRERLLARIREDQVRPEPMDETTLASLRALGYLGGAVSDRTEASFSELPDPKDRVATYNEILELSVLSGPTGEALLRLAKVLQGDPANPRALQIQGSFLLRLRRPREALAAFEKLPEESFERHYGSGRALMELGENDEARERLERALAIDPRSASALSRLAALERAEGDLEASERRLREAIDIEPTRSRYQDLADLLMASGRGEELARLVGAWEGPDGDAAAAYARGQLLASEGNPEGALAELERALRLGPEDDHLEHALANTLSRVGRFEEAAARYESVLRRTPCYLGALTNLGAALERLGREEEAIRSYQAAIGCDPRYANAYKNLGAALARKGELRRAVELLREAEKLSPGDPELRTAIAELESMLPR